MINTQTKPNSALTIAENAHENDEVLCSQTPKQAHLSTLLFFNFYDMRSEISAKVIPVTGNAHIKEC